MADAVYSVNDLTSAACYALTYVQALVAGKDSARWKAFAKAQSNLTLTVADQRTALAKGLAELREMGIIECSRDGEGDLVPTVLHEERIQGAGGAPRIVVGDLN